MEETSELQPEENKVSMEKSTKRKLKTPAQLKGLENFYTEHKYPTEELKLVIAEELGLTEKQVSGWFCHRRLKDKRLSKDESTANGRQDRSSGVIQDRGSGLGQGQDSCGSSKHGDYRNHFSENVSGMDDTSSESSSYLQERLYPQGQGPYEMEPSRYLASGKSLPPLKPKGAMNMGYKPSGYLKVKGEIEHAAITAVKKQLGRNYLEDGPLLGVEFDPLPPGAFECQTQDPVPEPYCFADPALLKSPEISTAKRRPGLSSRYDSYYTKHSSQDTHMEEDDDDFGSLRDAVVHDKQDKEPLHGTKHRQAFQSNATRVPARNSSLDLYEDSTGEAAYNITKNHRKDTKRGVEDFLPYEYENTNPKNAQRSVHAEFLQYDYDSVNPKNAQRSEHVKTKPSNSIRNSRGSADTEERELSTRMTKEEMFKAERKAKKQFRDTGGAAMLSNETMVAKRLKPNTFLPYNANQFSASEIEPRKIQRSGAEMPSSFSEDETGDTSSSLN
ncbi:unnamed protein product [Vicia faba]|uniref:Homeobox domain-containing protein n=1 Tax=Vicia faba TaxID=3906 RepID=A0AAV0YQS0_VICFA|nr:unnamed protein product [Vicia faba]